MTEIMCEEEKEQVGTIYVDQWEDKKLRFQNNRKGTQQILHRKEMDDKLRRNNWFVEYIETPSDDYEVVYQENVNHLCSRCEQYAMFDSEKHEFYCPRCSE